MKQTLFTLFLSLLTIYQSYSQTNLDETITHNGIQRSYLTYIPEVYDENVAVPLLFNLHGYTSSAIEQQFYGDFRPIADTANFILVHPNGTIDENGNRWWNAFGFTALDDVGFLTMLIDELRSKYTIDTNRIYSTGMSNGGFMSYELACYTENKIAAVASVTGTMTKNRMENCLNTSPTPVLQIHGTNDATVPYNGTNDYASMDELIDFWVTKTGADTSAIVTNLPDIDTNDNSTVEHYLYANGQNGTSVEFYKVLNGGHTWPGSTFEIQGLVTNQDINASVEIWRFLSQYSLNNVLSAPSNEFVNLSIYPNPSEGDITIKSNQKIDQIQIMDLTGRILKDVPSGFHTQKIHISQKGIFFINIVSNGKIYTEKIIIH